MAQTAYTVVLGGSFESEARLVTMRHQFRPLRVDRSQPAILTADLHAPNTTAHLECADRDGGPDSICLEGKVTTALPTECVLLWTVPTDWMAPPSSPRGHGLGIR